jgi:hypothetical protein
VVGATVTPADIAVLRALLGGAASLLALEAVLPETPPRTIAGVVRRHARAGRVATVREGRKGARLTVTDAGREALANMPAPRVRALPVVGHYLARAGKRRDDCALADDCTTAHALAYSGPASCPRGCRWYAPAEPLRAVEYASSGRSNGEAAIYAAGGGA